MPVERISIASNIGPFTLEGQEFFKRVLSHCHLVTINLLTQERF